MRLARTVLGLIMAASVVGCALPRADRAEPRIAPLDALPPPYDFTGVRDAVAGRGTTISIPTIAEVAHAGTPPQAFVRDLPATIADSYRGEARAVSVYIVIVDRDDSRLPLDHRLSYVVETTGHQTGNCFDFFDANTGDAYMAACFFPSRSSP